MITTMNKVERGTLISVQHYIDEGAKKHLSPYGGANNYVLLYDAYILGEKVFHSSVSYVHVWQILKAQPGCEVIRDMRFWARLRMALTKYGEKSFILPNDVLPMRYDDEIAVADFTKTYKGFERKYFVVKKAEIQKYLMALPLDEAGEERRKECIRERAEQAAMEELRGQIDDGKILMAGWKLEQSIEQIAK